MDVDQLNNWAERLRPHLYIGTFGLLFACGVAIPMPEEPVLLAAGYISYKSGANVYIVMICAMAGVLLGDTAIFTVGRRHGDWVFKSRLFRWLLPEESLARARRLFAEHGSKVVFFGRFIAGLRFVVFFTAGNLGVPMATYLVFDGLAALITVPTSVYIAYYFGENVDRALHFAKQWQRGLLIAVGVLVAVFIVVKLRSRSKVAVPGAAPAESPPPVASARDESRTPPPSASASSSTQDVAP